MALLVGEFFEDGAEPEIADDEVVPEKAKERDSVSGKAEK